MALSGFSIFFSLSLIPICYFCFFTSFYLIYFCFSFLFFCLFFCFSNRIKSWFFKKINNIWNPLAELIKRKKRGIHKLSISGTTKRTSKDMHNIDIKIKTIGYYGQLYANKFYNLDEWASSLKHIYYQN